MPLHTRTYRYTDAVIHCTKSRILIATCYHFVSKGMLALLDLSEL